MALTAEKEARIWRTLNETRGKIEPSEYKNYIFGLMFYKFLSDRAQEWLDANLRGESWEDVWNTDSASAADYMTRTIGFVIRPGEMFVDWQKAISEDKFNVGMMQDAIAHFDNSLQGDAKADFADLFADI